MGVLKLKLKSCKITIYILYVVCTLCMSVKFSSLYRLWLPCNMDPLLILCSGGVLPK